MFYKHAAPQGLNGYKPVCAFGAMLSGGIPSGYAHIALRWSAKGYKHVAPLGLWSGGMLSGYKHVAPLGL